MSTKDNQDDENSPTDLDLKLDNLSINKKQKEVNDDLNEESNLDNSLSFKKKIIKFRILNDEQSASNENFNLNNLDNSLDDNEQQQFKSEQFIPPTLLANNLEDEQNEDNKTSNNENNEPDKPKPRGRPGRKKGSKIKKLNLDDIEDSSIRRRSSRLKVLEEKKDDSPIVDNLNSNELDNLNQTDKLDNEINDNLRNDNQIIENNNNEINEIELLIENKEEDQDKNEDLSSNKDKKKKTKDKKKSTTKKQDDKRKSRRKSTNKSDNDENDNLDNRPNLIDNNSQMELINSSQNNLSVNQDLNDSKPEKVKSRWRRNSELESNHDNLTNDTISNDIFTNNDPFQSNDNQLNERQQKSPPQLDEEMNKEPMPEFSIIDGNLYLVEKKQTKFTKEVKKMVCDCILTKEERSRNIMGCGEDCLNRMLMIECGNRCPLDDHCSNKRFFRKEYSKVEAFKTLKKGWGLRAKQSIQPGQFIMEYVGEVIGPHEFNIRVKRYSKEERVHHFFMALKADEIIDATYKGNITRFVNHSCDPNAETQKWTVNGDLRIGFFSTKFIKAGEEITFDYQFQRYGKEAQKCFCESLNCRGYIGGTSVSKQVEIEDDTEDDTETVKKDKSVSKLKESKEEFEDLGLEEEIAKLKAYGGLRNRQQTMMLARLMVRAEDTQNRFKLLEVIRNTTDTEPQCLRVLLDYHCLQLIWSWMVDLEDIDLKSEIIKILELLPIPNKTMLKDSKIIDVIEKWSKQKDTVTEDNQQKKSIVNNEQLTNGDVEMKEEDNALKSMEIDLKKDDNLGKSITETKDNQTDKPNESGSSSSLLKNFNIIKKDSKTNQEQPQKSRPNISVMATRLLNLWKDLKEVYRIPRLERQKRHEDEKALDEKADRKALENDSRLINNTLQSSLRRNLKRPFDTGNRSSTTSSYNNYKQHQYSSYNNQNDVSSNTTNKISKEEHRVYYNIDLMRKGYEEAMKEYKKQVQEYTDALKQQLSKNSDINTSLSIAQLQPPMPPAPPNINLQNLTATPTLTNNNSSSTNNYMNNNLTNQQYMTISAPGTNKLNFNSNNKLYNDEFNNQLNQHNQINSNHTTPIYNFNDTNAQQQYYSQDTDYFNKSAHQSQTPTTPSQQKNHQELITYNHLIQPSQTNQQEIQQIDYTQQQQTEDESLLNNNNKSWNTLFAELTAGVKSNLIELTNEQHQLSEQKNCNQPDHSMKYNQVDELSEKEIKRLDDLFLTPGTYFVSENKTYFIPSNFINKKNYDKDQLIIESNGDFDIPSKELTNTENLPKDWSYLKNKNGYYYYYNESNNQVQWNVPSNKDMKRSINDNQDINNIDIATLNEILKLSNGLNNEQDPRKRIRSDNNSNSIDFDLQEQLNNNLSMDLENKIVKFPYQQPQPAVKHYSERRMKEKFKTSLSEHIKNVLNPYRKHDCKVGRILCNDDFKHLARKLTHMILLKELKYCKSAESLVLSDTVKHKSREFVKKYMTRYTPFFVRQDEEDEKEEERMNDRGINSPVSQYSQHHYSAQNSETNSINTTPTSNQMINNELDLTNNIDLSNFNKSDLLNDNLNENIASYESTNSTIQETINLTIIEQSNSIIIESKEPANMELTVNESSNIESTNAELTNKESNTDSTTNLIDTNLADANLINTSHLNKIEQS